MGEEGIRKAREITHAIMRINEKIMQPRQDSNLDQTFRKRLFYPLNYGAPLVNAPEVAPAAAAKMQRIRSLGT